MGEEECPREFPEVLNIRLHVFHLLTFGNSPGYTQTHLTRQLVDEDKELAVRLSLPEPPGQCSSFLGHVEINDTYGPAG